jgi:hypothetical protein
LRTIWVKAADPSRPVFLIGRKRELDADGRDLHVIRDTPVEVPDVRYYRRRIEAGDLVLVPRVSVRGEA